MKAENVSADTLRVPSPDVSSPELPAPPPFLPNRKPATPDSATLPPSDARLLQLVTAVLESAKYRDICPALIRRLGTRELASRRNLKEAIKETKNTLHQIAGAYLPNRMRYVDWEAALLAAGDSRTSDDVSPFLAAQPLREACVDIMANHASTRERLPILPDFYTALLADIAREAPIRSVLDIACGLNPLAAAWMPLAPGAAYYACDLYGDMMGFLNRFFALSGMAGEAFVADVVANPPTQTVDVALVLKALPVLDASDRTASLRLLRALQATHIVVSFPTRSLGGRGKGMAENYATRFHSLVAGEPWTVRPVEFPGELCFVVRKADSFVRGGNG